MWGNTMGWGPYGAYGGGWQFLGALHMVLWWVLIVLGILVLARWLFGAKHGDQHGPSEDRALGILRERYARGEIDKTEFEARRKDLST